MSTHNTWTQVTSGEGSDEQQCLAGRDTQENRTWEKTIYFFFMG